MRDPRTRLETKVSIGSHDSALSRVLKARAKSQLNQRGKNTCYWQILGLMCTTFVVVSTQMVRTIFRNGFKNKNVSGLSSKNANKNVKTASWKTLISKK